MSVITVSSQDLLRNTIVSPAWYLLHIDDFSESMSKDGKSINFLLETSIIEDNDTGSTEFANVPVAIRFNSKAMGFVIGFLKAMGEEVDQNNNKFDLSHYVGRDIVAFVENREYNGQITNDVKHKYRAAI